MSYFYAHIFDADDIHKDLEALEMTDDERNHLVMLIHSTLHHRVLDIMLEELHDDHKHVFLQHVVEENHDGVWEVLDEHVEGAEARIREVIEALKVELLGDVGEVYASPS